MSDEIVDIAHEPWRRILKREWNRRCYEKNQESYREREQRWKVENREHVRDRSRRWSSDHKENIRRYKFGPNAVEHFNAQLESQANRCAVCSTEFINTPNMDHDHSCCVGQRSCGKCLRGVLCDKCNMALGLFGDSTEVLQRAIRYLETWKEKLNIGVKPASDANDNRDGGQSNEHK